MVNKILNASEGQKLLFQEDTTFKGLDSFTYWQLNGGNT